MKLLTKIRTGAKVTKRYDPIQTPCQRWLAAPEVDAQARATLQAEFQALDPLALLAFDPLNNKQSVFINWLVMRFWVVRFFQQVPGNFTSFLIDGADAVIHVANRLILYILDTLGRFLQRGNFLQRIKRHIGDGSVNHKSLSSRVLNS